MKKIDEIHDVITINQILSNYKYLGIPHFQRGLIWKDSNVSALLESLFFDIPCGCVVLWQIAPGSKDKLDYGEGLIEEDGFDFLIVDGQQRIVNLYKVKKNIIEEDELIWCFNLPKLINTIKIEEDFNIEINHSRLLKQPLFVKTNYNYIQEYERETKTGAILYHNYKNQFLPLGNLFQSKINIVEIGKIVSLNENKTKNEIINKINEISIRVNAIFDKELFLIKLSNKSKPNKKRFPDIINIYNKINSEGMVAKPEELALAHLTYIHKNTAKEIKELYKAIHGDSEKDNSKKRQKENQFGFKLFIRTFILVCNYHFNIYIKSKDLSIDVLEKNEHVRNHIRKNDDVGKKLWEKTRNILVSFKQQILEGELYCDDLRFLPEINSILPVYMMMLRYETIIFEEGDEGKIRELFVKPLARLTLGLVLNIEKDIYDILNKIRLSTKKIEDMFVHLYDNQAKFPKSFEEQLENSNSIQSKHLKLLYWLERKNKAKDFSYKLNDVLEGEIEEEIQTDLNPEKQHLIPFSILKNQLYPKATRGGSHIANNIGNLTYISQALNSCFGDGLGKGLGKTPLKLKRDEDKENNSKHLIDENIVELYDKVLGKPTEYKFIEFITKRRELISSGFKKWFEELNTTEFIKEELSNIISIPEFAEELDFVDQIINKGFTVDLMYRIITLYNLNEDSKYKWNNKARGGEINTYRRYYLKEKESKDPVAHIDIYFDKKRMFVSYKSGEIPSYKTKASYKTKEFTDKIIELGDFLTQ